MSRQPNWVIAESFRVLLGQPAAEPGLVVCVHTFGNLLNFHPYLHVKAPDGGFMKIVSFIEDYFARHRESLDILFRPEWAAEVRQGKRETRDAAL